MADKHGNFDRIIQSFIAVGEQGSPANRLIDRFSFVDKNGDGITRNITDETFSKDHAKGDVIQNNHLVSLSKNENAFNVLYLLFYRTCITIRRNCAIINARWILFGVGTVVVNPGITSR